MLGDDAVEENERPAVVGSSSSGRRGACWGPRRRVEEDACRDRQIARRNGRKSIEWERGGWSARARVGAKRSETSGVGRTGAPFAAVSALDG